MISGLLANRLARTLCLAAAVQVLGLPRLCGVEIDLRPHWDETIPLHNPHKGWYHHLYDNHVNKYAVGRDADLLEFPGMDHVYLRLAWAYVEPEEGRFNWRILDEPVEKWTAAGLGVALRLTCKETNADRVEQQFATPSWVRDAGAKGDFFGYQVPRYQTGSPPDSAAPPAPSQAWEPGYGDPVFLEKLDRFLSALAARYDGKPWLRYLDIGSFGDWGEGHTSHGSKRKYGLDVLQRHVDLHLRHFRRTQLVISDDFVFHLEKPEERQSLHARLMRQGVTYRDDSILVDWYVQTRSSTFTVRSPEWFAEAAPETPTVLELEHYGIVKNKGNWAPRPGSSLSQFGAGRQGADFLRGALELLHASYIGYHGYAGEWLADNPALTTELLNRCGYWFFPHRVTLPGEMTAGRKQTVTVAWQNRGVARSYQPYTLILRLEGPGVFESECPSGNQRWLPGPAEKTWEERYEWAIPAELPPGDYEVKLKLHSPGAARDVKLPLRAELLDKSGFYSLARVSVAKAAVAQAARDPRLWPFLAEAVSPIVDPQAPRATGGGTPRRPLAPSFSPNH